LNASVRPSAIKVAPSILAADHGELGEEGRRVEAAGADLIHIDVMDGVFVPNITFGPGVVSALRSRVNVPLDVHLMVADPEPHLESFSRAGADVITVHVEACAHLHRAVAKIKALGARAGVALNPATPVCALDAILPELDLVLVMSVDPGFGGQTFIEGVLPKVSALARRAPEGLEIEIDGGIDPDTGARAAAAGATVLVAGSAVFVSEDFGAVVKALKACCGRT